MKLKLHNLIGFFRPNTAKKLDKMLQPNHPVPVSITGFIVEPSEIEPIDYIHPKKAKARAAMPFDLDVTNITTEPFPLRLLLDIMDRAHRNHEASFVAPTDEEDGYYKVSMEDAAKNAIRLVLGAPAGYSELARFIAMASFGRWNEISDLRESMIGSHSDHLLKSPKNAALLRESIAQHEAVRAAKAERAPHEEEPEYDENED